MFGHIFKNRLKVLLRTKSMIFWTLVFPLILATFFNLAFSNLSSDELFEPVNIGIVNDNKYKDELNFKSIIDTTSKNDSNQVFNVIYSDTEDQAKIDLENNKIAGYYIVKDKINIVVKTSGIGQTIMKYIVDNYYQTYSIMENIYQYNPSNFKAELVEELNNDKTYFIDKSNENIDFTVVYFYTLIGMVCLYGGFFGIDAVKETEANLSKRAARVNMAPTHKLKHLISSLLAGLVIQYIEVVILLGYLTLALKIDFGTQMPYILLLTFVGSCAGMSLGTLVGVSNKKSDEVKTAILLSATMTCSFLAGMMVWQMKYIIAENVPLLDKINPVSMITDALYSLYYYNTLDRYFSNILSLIILTLVMIGLSFMFIRRKKYDSI